MTGAVTELAYATDFAQLRATFAAGTTQDLNQRRASLRALKSALQQRERQLLDALASDLGKPEFEAFSAEVGFLYNDINFALANLKRWAKPRWVPTPLIHFPASSRIVPSPLGVVLIIGPWNYPLQLILSPLVGALAAGNVAFLKPSELAPACAEALVDLCRATFDPGIVAIATGDRSTTEALLVHPFNHVFFTGSTAVGRVVASSCAPRLIPYTLELGGKSPCIVAADAVIDDAARRIAWGKLFNAGQTCIAPDYVLVEESVRDAFVASLRREIESFLGAEAAASRDYARILTERHWDRMNQLVQSVPVESVVVGGKADRATRYFPPTVVVDPPADSPLLQEEVFGPVLSIVTTRTLDAAFDYVQARPPPLALYVFTTSASTERRFVEGLSFGGGCVNHTLIHMATPYMPFGGVGESGSGRYHGKWSFDVFTHEKSIMRAGRADVPVRYPPFGAGKMRFARFFMK